MENASKALIIAGAILLSILIIGLGMGVYNNATSSVGSSDMTAQEVSAHNQSFKAYAGKTNGSQVKALLSKIQTNNKEHVDRIINVGLWRKGSWHGIPNFYASKPETGPKYFLDTTANVDYTATGNTMKELIDAVKDNTTYKVEFYEDKSQTGCITACRICYAIN